ncbi:MAG: hypothetical protein ABIB46_04225 [bacterium]
MFKKISIFFGALFFCFFINSLMAIDDASTLDQGKFELENNLNFVINPDKSKDTLINTSLKHGITEKLDFCINIPYEIQPKQGFNDAEIGIKFALLKEKIYLPNISLSFSSELGSSDYTLIGILSQQFGKITLHINAGYTTNKDISIMYLNPISLELFLSDAIEIPISKKITLIGEIVSENNLKNLGAFLSGNLKISDTVNFVLEFGFQSKNNNIKKQITSGLIYEF